MGTPKGLYLVFWKKIKEWFDCSAQIDVSSTSGTTSKTNIQPNENTSKAYLHYLMSTAKGININNWKIPVKIRLYLSNDISSAFEWLLKPKPILNTMRYFQNFLYRLSKKSNQYFTLLNLYISLQLLWGLPKPISNLNRCVRWENIIFQGYLWSKKA